MRVLHVYKTYYPDTLGGIEQVLFQLTRGLAGMGIENRIFTVSPDPHPAVIVRPEAQVHRARTTIEVASNAVSLQALMQFRAHLRWADVVHYQFPWPFADLLHEVGGGMRASVVSYQSDVVRQKWLLKLYRPLMQRFLRSVDAVVATSPGYVRSSPVLGALPRAPRIIANGMDEDTCPQARPETLARWRAEVGEGFFFFVGVLRYYKGLHVLLEAARGFDGQVVIAGDGPEADELGRQAQALGLTNVRLLGRVDDQDKHALMQLCRAFVFPSHLRSEAFGMSLVEAAMHGKPMISCDIDTGTSYINVDGVTGWTVPPADGPALHDAMCRLQANLPQAAAFGVAARERYHQLFTARHMAHAYAQVYEEVLRQRTAGRTP